MCHGRLLVDRCQSASARPYTPCSHTVGQAHYRMATSSGDRKRSAMSLDMNQMFLTEHNNNKPTCDTMHGYVAIAVYIRKMAF